MAEDARKTEVIIFFDVDGVLNDKWIGHVESTDSSHKDDSFHPQLVDNLVELIRCLQQQHGLDPKLVLSTTWRLQPQSCEKLLELGGTGIEQNTTAVRKY